MLSHLTGLDVSNVTVRAKNGRVRLEGTVPEAAQSKNVEAIARSVQGVTVVENRLMISGDLGGALSKPECLASSPERVVRSSVGRGARRRGKNLHVRGTLPSLRFHDAEIRGRSALPDTAIWRRLFEQSAKSEVKSSS